MCAPTEPPQKTIEAISLSQPLSTTNSAADTLKMAEKRKKKEEEKTTRQSEEAKTREVIAERQEQDQVSMEEEGIEDRRRKKDKKSQENRKMKDSEEKSEVQDQVSMEEDAAEEKRRKKEKKHKKRRMKEVEEQGGIHLVSKEQEHVPREEEGTQEEEKKKEKKQRKRKIKEEVEEEEEEGGRLLKERAQNLQSGKEEDVVRLHSLEESAALLNGETAMESGAMVSANSNRDPTAADTEKKNKKENKRKRVTFEEQIITADQEQGGDVPNGVAVSTFEGLMDDAEEVWGVRFSPEEDAILKDAVWSYIKSKGWDEHSGLQKVLNSNKHRDARNCWAEIKMSLPHRPRQAVRFRAHVLLETGSHLGKWTKEEEDLLMRLQKERGHKWREISSILNRHRASIKEKWRSLKRSTNEKRRGQWSQGELQQLSDMVHKSLRLNRLQSSRKEKLDRHILRDNIAWEKIADTLGTRNHGPCCSKWYYNLQSSLVSDGLWANDDDFLLLRSLLESGAFAEEEVEWDNVLEHRPGQICLTRWQQMVKHLGENRTRQFLDKLDILVRRYAPELLETSTEDNMKEELPIVIAQAS